MPTPSITVRGLLLDMDGTLVNSDAVVARIWRDWAAEQGLDPDEVLRVAHGLAGPPDDGHGAARAFHGAEPC